MDAYPGDDRGGVRRQTLLLELRHAYSAALLDGDEVAAERAVRDAMEARLSSAEIDEELIAPALWLVGEMWERGEISVADEHLATEITMRVLALQHEARRAAAERPHQRVLLAAPAGERHVIGLRLAGDLLGEAGYAAHMVGADVPTVALAGAVERHRPAVVCLTATMPRSGARLPATIRAIEAICPGTSFLLGGAGLPARMRERPGLAICRQVSAAVECVDALIQRAALN
jgi:methanogenic corrinoid protein MtbC1